MHTTKIQPSFEGIHIASLSIEVDGLVHITPQINSPRRIIVQEGLGSVVVIDINSGGVCKPGEIVDVPSGAQVHITNLSDHDHFILAVVQKTSLDEKMFEEA